MVACDSNAPSEQTMINISVDPSVLVAALVAAGYIVTAPVIVVTPPPPPAYVAPTLLTVMCQNGQTPLEPQDYSYAATDAHADTVDGGHGNAACVKVTLTGPWGGFQPSANPAGPYLNFGTSSRIVCSVSAPKGTQFSMSFLTAGDTPIKTAADTLFTKTVDGYEDFSFSKAALMTDITGVDHSPSILKGSIQAKIAVIPAAGFSFLVDNWGGM